MITTFIILLIVSISLLILSYKMYSYYDDNDDTQGMESSIEVGSIGLIILISAFILGIVLSIKYLP